MTSKSSFEPPKWTPFPAASGVRIGIFSPNYGLEHVSYAMDLPDTRFVRLGSASARRFGKGQFWQHTPVLYGAKVDLVHTFNHIPVNKPFIVSHEMELPRNLGPTSDWQMRTSLRMLQSDRCRAILSLSEAAARYVRRRFEEWGHGSLARKMRVFRGCVHPPTATPAERETGDRIELLFVGGDGLRKGLSAAVAAAERLHREGVNLRLTIVGRVTEGTYVLPDVRIPGAELQARIDTLPFIRQFEGLPHADIWRLMRESDVLVFPTVDESLGWVTIEAGLVGKPAIVSSVFAQPELVRDGVSGWVLPMDLDEDGRWKHIARPEAVRHWPDLMEGFTEGIVSAVRQIADNPALIAERGTAAMQHLAPYRRENATRELSEIYRGAMSSSG